MRSAYIDELNDPAITAIVGRHQAVPSPHSEIHLHHFGGAVAHAGDDRHLISAAQPQPRTHALPSIMNWKSFQPGLTISELSGPGLEMRLPAEKTSQL